MESKTCPEGSEHQDDFSSFFLLHLPLKIRSFLLKERIFLGSEVTGIRPIGRADLRRRWFEVSHKWIT